ncbi:hypothetical protein PILCRDRAFT_817915 [Piloderma croceum F 1598]|uniref:Uncharacterized protein n=1 Tax=Piloderma croceum (strain F 1598) TaxID=765440 RepID=A0A0C3FLX1_PILCF|nr:hypothetical protein PILCRDRAFT_817915 [Piloderma croceum F 1598]
MYPVTFPTSVLSVDIPKGQIPFAQKLQHDICSACTFIPCTSVHSAGPILFPSLSSLKGDDSDVTPFLQSGGQYQNCRCIVIDSQWEYPGNMSVTR